MIFNHPRQTSTHPFFPLLEASVPECFWQRSGHRVQQGHIMKPCPTVSPRVLFFRTLAGFSCGAWTLVSIFWRVSMYHPCVECQQQWFHGICPANDLENDKSYSIFCWLGPSWIFCEGNPCYNSSGTFIHPPHPLMKIYGSMCNMLTTATCSVT